jgi:hypothetical protein
MLLSPTCRDSRRQSARVSASNADDFAVMGRTCGASAALDSSCSVAPIRGGSAESASMAVNLKGIRPARVTSTFRGPGYEVGPQLKSDG